MTCVERIELMLKERGITRNKFSKDIGISNATFYNWQSRGSTPKSETLQKIADYLGTTTDYLLGKSDEQDNIIFRTALEKVAHDQLDNAIKEKSRSEKRANRSLRDEMIDRIAIEAKGRIPIVGTIRAGLPLIAEEFLEGWAYSPIKNTGNEIEYFYLRVTGDSMIGAGIEEGSLVLIHKQNYAENGQIVACMVDEEDATLKRFRQQGNTIMLIPENPKYDPIVLSASDFDPDHGTAYIIGVAKQVTIDL